MSIVPPKYFNGPFLKKNKINFRHYQRNIFIKSKNYNTLLVLPTGLGKTIIAILLISHTLNKYQNIAKILILAPTRPLVSQHKSSCEKFLDVELTKIVSFTGQVVPEKRIFQYNNASIIISTPQIIKNDLMRNRYNLNDVGLIIFDEAHRTKGNYAYTYISERYMKECTDPLILGLTASPGKDFDHIQQLCSNLFIENIVFKTYEDNDVIDYIHEIDTFIERVDLPISFIELSEVWNHLFQRFLKFFFERDLINPFKKYFSKMDFLKIAHDLSLSLKYENLDELKCCHKEFNENLWSESLKIIEIVNKNKLNIESIFSYCSSCISILHAKDLLETQDISLFTSFLNKLAFKSDQNIKSAKRIINSDHYNLIKTMIENLNISNLSHPKIKKLVSIINDEIHLFENNKIIIFTQYREMAEKLKQILLNEFSSNLKIEKFIGQSTKVNDFGYSQKKQLDILYNFKEDKIDILIATSVAEEGLDIPNVDCVIFYEPVPSEIRLIQRRGRTGRNSPGRCFILLTEDTVDIPFYVTSKKKEAIMNSTLLNPNALSLVKEINRKKIIFEKREDADLKYDIVNSFKERRDYEKEIIINQSIEDIISEFDNFSKSKKYQILKKYGVSLYSDFIKLDKEVLKKKISILKGKRSKNSVQNLYYLNKNLKTLINIVKMNENQKMKFHEFQYYALEEDILDKKFHIHFNQACNLGYLEKKGDYVYLIKDYN